MSVLDISPLPKIVPSETTGRKRRAEAAAVITSSPYKAAVKEKESHRKQPAAKRLNMKESDLVKSVPQAASTAKGTKKTGRSSNAKKTVHAKFPVLSKDGTKPTGRPKVREQSKMQPLKRPVASSSWPPLPRQPVWMKKN